MKNRKQILGLCAGIVAVLVIVCAFMLVRQEDQLEQLQQEALLELERNAGQYDEQSIVLHNTSKAKAKALAALYGAELRITENGRFATLTLPEGTTIRDVYAMDESQRYIEEMAADYQVKVSDVETEEEESGGRLPQRPQYAVTDTDYELQTYLDYLNMSSVWESFTGWGVTVAVIDTGIDTDHPEFAGRISEYSYNATEDKIVKDYLLEDGSYDWSLIEDEQGHGTAVAGVIAASMNDGNVVGVAPDANILVIKAECDPQGNFSRISDLIYGLYYAIEQDVQVVNMSFTAYGDVNLFAEATQLAHDSDVICVAAAGNDATSSLAWPAADEYVVGVGALGDGWTLAEYSNYGENVNLVAPGTTYTTCMGGGYRTTQGTSLACPVVVGAIALYMQNHRYSCYDEITEVLYVSCYDLGELGKDWYYGFGALDIGALMLEARGTIIYDMLTDELENEEGIFIQGHTLQELPEPERLYAVFDGWYYDDTCTEEYNNYEDKLYGEVTLYAKWVNEDEENEGMPYTYVILEDGTVEISSYTGRRRFITIPEKIEGRTVSSIGDFAFSGQTRLREVNLPSGLTRIGQNAFLDCANLVSIQIPANVTEIEEGAFAGNVRLSSVAFENNSKLTTIGDLAFKNCGRLSRIELPASLRNINGAAFSGTVRLSRITVRKGSTAFKSQDGVLLNFSGSTVVAFPIAWGSSYTLPETVVHIGENAFSYAKLEELDLGNVQTIGAGAFAYAALERVTIPDSVTSMGADAFAGNVNLLQLTLGSGLTEITAGAFEDTVSLRSVTIPKGISTIGEDAFCFSGLQEVTFEEDSGLVLIGERAFQSCAIEQVDIPASVAKVDAYAFASNLLTRVGFAENAVLGTIDACAFLNCNQLKHIALPAGLHTIGRNAFRGSGLTAVTIPAAVTKMEEGAFAFCADLTAIEVESGNAVYHDVDGVVYNVDNTKLCSFPAGKETAEYVVESTVRTIAPSAFAGANKVGNIVLPEGMTQVGEYAFYQCGAASYTLPSTLTRIMDYAFAENQNLQTIALPDALEEIGQYAFTYCRNLQTIHIPDNVLKIGRFAFAQNWNLDSVTFNETAKLPRISTESFAYCGLRNFTVPANVSTMAQKVFVGCKNLTDITFAKNSKLKSISAYMFDGCSNLMSIVFEEGSALTSIQAHALDGLEELMFVDFGDAKLTNVDNFAFRFCENLSALQLPETLTNIGRYAFYGCKHLWELTIPENVEHIGSYAFLGTNDISLYFEGETLPQYLDEEWDRGVKGYYTGVSSVEENGEYKYAVLNSGNIAILEYLGAETAVDLSTLDLGGAITTIGGGAFAGSDVTSITLPSTLTAIQAEAFLGTKLESITIPASVRFIGREAFAYTSIKNLTFAADSQLEVVEQYAFEGTKHLASVTLPASLTTMGTGVFMESGLQSVTFAEGIQITEIPQRAFAYTKLTSVALPDSVSLVNHNAFNSVRTLKSVAFGNNDGIRLMSNAFYNTGLTSLHIPENVTYIGEYCFVALTDLTEFSVDENNTKYQAVDGLLLDKSGQRLIAVPGNRTGTLTVPAGVEVIGSGAFEESKLSQVLFHKDANILTFGYRAFFKAENITTITIPKSVVSIGYYAFAYCKSLQEVNFVEGNQLAGIYEGAFLGCINLEDITIPNSIVEIADFAFYGCSKIDELPISAENRLEGIYDYAFAYTNIGGEFTAPETLIDIGDYAFRGTKVTKVTIPDTNQKVLTIGIGAFEECHKLTEITLPFIGGAYEDEHLSWFGYIFGAGSYKANGIYVPESLKTVTITEGITFLGDGGFSGCTNLQTIHIPHSVSELGDRVFDNVTAEYSFTNAIAPCEGSYLENTHVGKGVCGYLTLSDDVTSVSLDRCEKLTGITIPGSVKSIERDAFRDCTALERVVLDEGVTSIGDYAFENCSSLQSIEIPDSVTTIGAGAFYRCSSLASVTLGSGLTSVGASAFFGCNKIGQVHIDNVANWCAITFANRDSNPCSGSAGLYVGGKFVTELEIPSGITEIGAYAFCNCDQLKNITIPKGVTSIGASAFGGCNGLISVTIPDTVTAIGESGFLGCDALERIDIPDGVTTIENKAFYSCDSLTGVSLPDGLTTIGQEAFYRCTKLANITIPDGVASIGEHAFYGAGLDSITIPSSITSIGDFAFYECSRLRTVTNLSALEVTLGSEAHGRLAYYAKTLVDAQGTCYYADGTVLTEDGFLFYYDAPWSRYVLIEYTGDADTVTLPTDLNGSSYVVFSFRGAKHVIIPDGFTDVYTEMFYNCKELESVTIPESVTNIGSYAFYGCDNLDTVIIPDSVTSFGANAFSENTSVLTVDGNPALRMIDGIMYNGDLTSIVSVSEDISGDLVLPDGLLSIPRQAFYACEGLTSVTIPDSVTSIGDKAFYNCPGLTSVNISDSVTSIGSQAFYYCKGLTSINIPDSVTSIGGGAFGYCTNLRDIIISEDHPYYCFMDGVLYSRTRVESHGAVTHANIMLVTNSVPDEVTIMDGVCLVTGFEGNQNIKSIVLPDSVTDIYRGAFSGCTGLTSITIPDSVTSIGKNAFSGCSSLTDITIPSGVTTIEDYTFSSCKRLTSITIPDGVTSIGKYAFSGCSGLTSITIPDSVTSIGEYAFSDCSGLTDLPVFNGVTSIGRYAFLRCTGLTKITIPGNVTTIGDCAFGWCENLQEATFSEGVTTLGTETFFACDNLERVTIPASMTSMGAPQFGECKKLQEVVVAEDSQSYCFVDGILYDKPVTQIIWVSAHLPEHVTIPEGVTSIGDYVFRDHGEVKTVTLPNSLLTIGEYAFLRCNALTSITIPDSVTTIGYSAFDSCEALESVVIGSGVTSMDMAAFANCAALKTVVIAEGVTAIADFTFTGCSNLTSVTIPESMTYIGRYAFSSCTGLTSLRIPDAVTTIGENAFGWCDNLRELIVSENNANYCSADGILYDKPVTQILWISPAVSGEVAILDGVTTIPDSAFQGKSGLTSITIPASVTAIADYAFYDCGNLLIVVNNSALELTLGGTDHGYIAYYAKILTDAEGNKTYADGGFETEDHFLFTVVDGVYTLRAYVGEGDTVTLPSSVNGSSYVIYQFQGARHVIIPEGITSIGNDAFYNCKTLESIVLPSSITSIGERAFYDCTSLEGIELPAGLISISDRAFWQCERLQSMELPAGLTSIGGAVFFGCKNLQSIDLPDSLTSIGYSAFYGCESLTNVTLPANITAIEAETFCFCSNLVSITIPAGVTSIGNRAFTSCGSLVSIDIPDGVEYIGEDAFSGCTKLASIEIPARVEYIGRNAFAGCTALCSNPEYRQNGMMIIDGWVVDVDEDLEYLVGIENIRGVVSGAYANCAMLKSVVWGDMYLLGNWAPGTSPTNVETICVTNITGYTAYISNMLTLKNIVICDSVGVTDLRNCVNLLQGYGVSNVTIFVEALENDVRWDVNFPGWSNGNTVVYGDQWHWVNFYDENGKLIYSEPRLNAQITRLPVYEIASDEKYTYEIVGWDVDGDGQADSIPATTLLDINAQPVVQKTLRNYTVTFMDKSTGTVYYSQQLAYGTAVTAPGDPAKQGYDFVGWTGLTDGLIVTGDTVIYASWQHQGEGHAYGEAVWVDATCTEPGFYKHACTTCGEYYGTDYTQALGHVYESSTVVPECTAQGYDLHTCSRCGDSYQDNFVDATGHSYGNWIVDEAAQCLTGGMQHRICGVCGHREDAKIEAKGHDFVATERIESTCTTVGQQTYCCTGCGTTVTEVLALKAHSYEKKYASASFLQQLLALMEDILWGYEGDDVYYYACTDCQRVMSVAEAETLGAGVASTACRHTQATWTAVKTEDCSGAGIEGYLCDSCGEVLDMRTFGQASEHVDAVQDHICDVCGQILGDCEDADGDDVCDWCGVKMFTYGDADGDGYVDGRDLLLLRKYIANYDYDTETSTIEVSEGADANGDGEVDGRDLLLLRKYIANYDYDTGESTVILGPQK